jgi:hypothetical protein
MSGVSLTPTIMYTKPLFVSYPPNIQTIIWGENLGGRVGKHLGKSKGVLKAQDSGRNGECRWVENGV